VFHELLGFADTTGAAIERTRAAREAIGAREGVCVSIAPHAPYSTSPELCRAVRQAVDNGGLGVTSIHVGESPEEIEMLAHGTGAWPAILRRLGAWREDWTPPGTGPVEYLDGLGVLRPGTLVVHGVQLSDEGLARLAARDCVLVTCPRSNQWVGVGVPPIERFYRSGVRVAVGTDSLASVGDLNLFSELKEMRWLAPAVPAARLLESATIQGARALRLDAELGTIEAGKRAALIAVTLPGRGVESVEEHLVSGIEPAHVKWVEA
jgi:cytosine/adenosine deaminase-related metal-dependent hydrolase